MLKGERGLSAVGIIVGLVIIFVSLLLILAALPAISSFPTSIGGFSLPLVVPWYLQLPAAVVTLGLGFLVILFV